MKSQDLSLSPATKALETRIRELLAQGRVSEAKRVRLELLKLLRNTGGL